jgi:hypothetical protein
MSKKERPAKAVEEIKPREGAIVIKRGDKANEWLRPKNQIKNWGEPPTYKG